MRKPAEEDEAGFATAAFASAAFAAGVIATAALLASNLQLENARRAANLEIETYRLRGALVQGTALLLSEPGQPTLRWRTAPPAPIELTAEPENLKLALSAAARPDMQAYIQALATGEDRDLSAQLAALPASQNQAVRRRQIVDASPRPAWRRCALTLLSPYSRLTAFRLASATTPVVSGANQSRAGELWRITARTQSGVWIDQLVRFTGMGNNPVMTVEERRGVDERWRPAACLDQLDSVKQALGNG